MTHHDELRKSTVGALMEVHIDDPKAVEQLLVLTPGGDAHTINMASRWFFGSVCVFARQC